ncbi:MAG: B12-binding domain-containing radical SAM protein [Syntrophobacteraceae bacterium]
MSDILLIQPPIRDFYLTAKRTIPYGLACIAAPLIGEGYSVEILDGLATGKSKKLELPPEMLYLSDFYSGPDISPFSLFHDFRHFGLGLEAIGERVRDSGAFLVGISSLFTPYSAEAIRCAQEVKRKCPGAVTVLGGHHPTEMPEEVLRHDCVDFIIRGEGEVAMNLLADAIRGVAPVESVPGIGFRAAGGKFFIRSPAALNNLDDALLPAVELIDRNFYQRGKRPCAVIAASRGCPLGCSYCSIGCSSWSRFRIKSVRRVIEEMERAVFGIGARFIDFEDENISFSRQWFLHLLREIVLKFQGCDLELRAMNGLFPPALDEEVICAMKAAGFSALNLSLCTTCRDQLKRFRRPDVREDFERSLACAEKYGLEAVGYIIVGGPGQDPLDSVADLLYLADKNAIAGVSVFYPAPGSADFEKCRVQNLLPPELSLMRSTALPISDTTTREDSITLLRLGRILNFFKSLDTAEREEVLRLAGQHAPHNPVMKKSSPQRLSPEKPDGFDRSRGFELNSLTADACGSDAAMCEHQGNKVISTRERAISNRRAIGKAILGLFLRNGVIYGATPKGHLFAHRASETLCCEFREGLLRIFL